MANRWPLGGAIIVGLMLAYVLSYAPVVRVKFGPDQEHPPFAHPYAFDPCTLAGYQPVEWLIDRTALRVRLFEWAGVWGVDGKIRGYSLSRRIRRFADQDRTGM